MANTLPTRHSITARWVKVSRTLREVFCNLANGNTNWPNSSGAYALDVTTSSTVTATPGPTTMVLLAMGLLGVAVGRLYGAKPRIA
jgi:hypothetical protein